MRISHRFVPWAGSILRSLEHSEMNSWYLQTYVRGLLYASPASKVMFPHSSRIDWRGVGDDGPLRYFDTRPVLIRLVVALCRERSDWESTVLKSIEAVLTFDTRGMIIFFDGFSNRVLVTALNWCQEIIYWLIN